jgi:hypothetical protein
MKQGNDGRRWEKHVIQLVAGFIEGAAQREFNGLQVRQKLLILRRG